VKSGEASLVRRAPARHTLQRRSPGRQAAQIAVAAAAAGDYRDGVKWHVLHLRPRREKKVAENCRLLRFSHYLPLRTETKVYQRRRVTVQKPVFPGYLFASFDAQGRLELLKTNAVVRILAPGNQRELLHQLAQVRKALEVDPGLGAAAAISAGRLVRICDGPFCGVEGRVISLKGQTMVCLNVELVGQAVRVQIERERLEPLD
jgi:transcription antitermination factor NusG